jgi:hypothetical protein
MTPAAAMAAAFCMMLCWLLLLALQFTLTARGLEPAVVAGETYIVLSTLGNCTPLPNATDMFVMPYWLCFKEIDREKEQMAPPEKGFCAPALICCLCNNTTPHISSKVRPCLLAHCV